MASIVRPSREVVFGELRGPIPADRLDSQIQNLIDAIHSTQVALSEIRRDDGQLKIPKAQVQETADLEKLKLKFLETAAKVASSAAAVSGTARDVHLRVKDAETAAFAAVKSLAEVERQGATAQSTFDDAENAADRSEYYATQSQNSYNYAHAQSDNAISAKNEATQWAEYLAGPVVNAADAPAYIAGHPFGHGLYYQPVDGYGGVAGLWSAKWWAVYAAQLVGPWSFYFLGSWNMPPVPGATNPQTGVKVPNPLAPGSFYYNTTSNRLFVWDGSSWQNPYSSVLTPGIETSYVYIATAGQTSFSGADAYGKIPVVGTSPSDVHVNGLKKVHLADYTINTVNSVLILNTPCAAGDRVQWDLLSTDSAEVGVTVRKVTIVPSPDGVNTTFTMSYADASRATYPVNVTGVPQLQVSMDGIYQEPSVDFVATGATLTMNAPPPRDAKFWAVWFAAGATSDTPANSPPVNLTLPSIVGADVQGSTLTATNGGWAGYPTPGFSWQWKSGGVNVGSNQNTYLTNVTDVGKTITVVVTAANVAGSSSATSSPPFGPVTAIPDNVPDPFTFTDVTNAPLSTPVASNVIAVAGINVPVNISVTGGQYSKNGGGFTSAAGTVVVNDTIRVLGTSSASNSTAVNVVLTIGGVTDTFTITTLPLAPTYKPTYLIYFV